MNDRVVRIQRHPTRITVRSYKNKQGKVTPMVVRGDVEWPRLVAAAEQLKRVCGVVGSLTRVEQWYTIPYTMLQTFFLE